MLIFHLYIKVNELFYWVSPPSVLLCIRRIAAGGCWPALYYFTLDSTRPSLLLCALLQHHRPILPYPQIQWCMYCTMCDSKLGAALDIVILTVKS